MPNALPVRRVARYPFLSTGFVAVVVVVVVVFVVGGLGSIAAVSPSSRVVTGGVAGPQEDLRLHGLEGARQPGLIITPCQRMEGATGNPGEAWFVGIQKWTVPFRDLFWWGFNKNLLPSRISG